MFLVPHVAERIAIALEPSAVVPIPYCRAWINAKPAVAVCYPGAPYVTPDARRPTPPGLLAPASSPETSITDQTITRIFRFRFRPPRCVPTASKRKSLSFSI